MEGELAGMKAESVLSIPSADELLGLIEDVKAIHERERRTRLVGQARRLGGVVVYRERPTPLVVVGDLHGDVETLRVILSKVWGLLQEKGAHVVFLGDYIDRGPPQGQAAVLAAVLRLKKAMPDRVILLRGNHEPPPNLEPSPHDFPMALLNLYDRKAPELYQAARELFDTMPYAVYIKGWALLVHGGIPTESLLHREDPLEILGAPRDDPMDVIVEILWNDPTESVDFRRPSMRGVGYEWGPKATELAVRKLGVKYIIRAHEAVHTGFKLNHGGRVVTLFSRRGYPYGNPKAAFMTCMGGGSAESIASCIRVVGG